MNYNANNLYSVLDYVLKNYGIEVFRGKKLIILLEKLAPNLKDDRQIIARLSKTRILDKLVDSRYDSQSKQQSIVDKSVEILKNKEHLPKEVVQKYLKLFLQLFNYNPSIKINSGRIRFRGVNRTPKNTNANTSQNFANASQGKVKNRINFRVLIIFICALTVVAFFLFSRFKSQDPYQVVPKSVVGVSAIGTQQENTLYGLQSQQFQSTGSGFFITSNGYIMTNQHVVVNDNSQITISTQDGGEYEGKLVWSDTNPDFALIKIDVKDVQPLTIGNSDEIKIGEEVIAVGNPLGLDYSRSITKGIVSAVNRSLVVGDTPISGLIQTDAAINPGNSGGPLVNMKGEVIGVNTYKADQSEGMSFAFPINLFKPIIEEVIETGTFKPVDTE